MNFCSHGLPPFAAQTGGTQRTNGRTPDGETNLMPKSPEIILLAKALVLTQDSALPKPFHSYCWKGVIKFLLEKPFLYKN